MLTSVRSRNFSRNGEDGILQSGFGLVVIGKGSCGRCACGCMQPHCAVCPITRLPHAMPLRHGLLLLLFPCSPREGKAGKQEPRDLPGAGKPMLPLCFIIPMSGTEWGGKEWEADGAALLLSPGPTGNDSLGISSP